MASLVLGGRASAETGGRAPDVSEKTRVPDWPSPAIEFFVAPDGSDSATGTREEPFATLERARDALRQLKQQGKLADGGAVVSVRGGRYRVQQPFTLFGGQVVTHGSPYAYDTSVPLMIFGGAWIKAGKYPQAAAVADLAPTLSYLLEVRQPSGSEGRVLEEILK